MCEATSRKNPGSVTASIPETVADAIALWDSGAPVVTVSMGGLGEDYERGIQRLAFELMRAWQSLDWTNEQTWERDAKPMRYSIVEAVEDGGGYTGAMVGAASSLAACVCKHGYRAALTMPELDQSRLMWFTKNPAQSGGAQ